MSIYDKARELTAVLKQEELYLEFVEWQDKVHADPKLWEMLIDLRGKEYEVQKLQALGKEVAKAQKEQLRNLYEIARLNSVLSRYLEVEYRFGQMMMDIQKIINEAVPIKRPEKQGE